MNVSTELYEMLRNAKMEQCIFLATELLLDNPEKNIDIVQNTLIHSCSYIGSFVTIFDIRMWLDVIGNLMNVIDSDRLLIQSVYVLITKVCILCDTYLKRPRIRAGTLNIRLLRPKIIDLFSTDSVKLSSVGIAKFEGILPPADSPSYQLSIQIITGLVSALKALDSVSNEDAISDVAEKQRQSFDYITRKRYQIETTFYDSDNDCVWFMWGLICMLYHDKELDILYRLFVFGYSKRIKQQRIGLLWGSAVVMVYLKKRSLSREWNKKELAMIEKIDEVGLHVFNDIKRQISQSRDIPKRDADEVSREGPKNGIDFLNEYVPMEDASTMEPIRIDDKDVGTKTVKTVKTIRCKGVIDFS